MAITSIGDLAEGFILRKRNLALRTDLTRLTNEVASGQVADPVERLSGHFSYLSQIERDLQMAETYANAAKETAIASSNMQSALGQIDEVTKGLMNTLSLASTASGPTDLSIVAGDARGVLQGVISALNTSVAGRHLFSGTDVGSVPLVAAEELLTDLGAAVSGALTISDLMAAADAFFDTPGGGFETLVYQGGTAGHAPVALGSGEAADLDIRADDQAFRDIIKHVAVAALVDDPALSVPDAARRDLTGDLLGGLLGARDSLVALRSDLGFAEERIERAGTRLEAEMTSLQLARNELLSVDPYDAASELEAVRLQLETLYTLTARTSRLSLVNFLS